MTQNAPITQTRFRPLPGPLPASTEKQQRTGRRHIASGASNPRFAGYCDPYLCLLRAHDLSHLPGGFLVTTEFDPLRDEGRRLAERLREAGADIAHHHVPDLMHGFVLRTDEVARAAQEVERMCEQIERHLAGPGPAPAG
jgi:acetyl esterase/lipase